jgi:hypothetical protein
MENLLPYLAPQQITSLHDFITITPPKISASDDIKNIDNNRGFLVALTELNMALARSVGDPSFRARATLDQLVKQLNAMDGVLNHEWTEFADRAQGVEGHDLAGLLVSFLQSLRSSNIKMSSHLKNNILILCEHVQELVHLN